MSGEMTKMCSVTMTGSSKVLSTPSTSLIACLCKTVTCIWMPGFGNNIGSATGSDLCSYSSLSSHGYNIRAQGVDVLSDLSSVCFANLHETGGKKNHAVKILSYQT